MNYRWCSIDIHSAEVYHYIHEFTHHLVLSHDIWIINTKQIFYFKYIVSYTFAFWILYWKFSHQLCLLMQSNLPSPSTALKSTH